MSKPPPQPSDARRHDQVQAQILSEVLYAILPINLFAVLLILGSGLLKPPGQPLRVITPLIILGFLIMAWRSREARPYRAMKIHAAGMFAAIVFGMLANGGLRAPVAPLLLVAVVLCSLAFGRQAGKWVAVAGSLFAVLVALLDYYQLLPAPPQAPLYTEFVVLLVMLWVLWAAASLPQERLRETLFQAFARERDLQQAQEKMREAHLAFQAIFDQTEQMMSLLSPTGAIMSANKPALRALGVTSQSAILGRPFVELPWWPAAEQHDFQRAIELAIKQHTTIRLQPQYTDKTGRERVAAFSLSPFRDEQQKLKYLIAEGRDVTDLIEAKDRQDRKHRLELVGQLAGGVAHDFNNVTAAMLSSAELLRLELKSKPETQELVELAEIVISASKRAKDLTARLLSFARHRELEKQSLSLSSVIEETLKLLERTLPSNIKLEKELRAKQDMVWGNTAAISSALVNLIVNARDAMPGGGTVRLVTEEILLDGDWCALSGFDLLPGRFARITIKDSGQGIPQQLLPRIFEPFFTTKPEGRGTGLGLASVYKVICDLRGAIQVHSEPGQGTEFNLYCPLTEDVFDDAKTHSSEELFTGMKALFVDDESLLRDAGSRLLRKLGFECVTAADAESGLTAFEADPASFDLALLDVYLPGRLGTELAVDLLETSPKLRVLLVSGFQKETTLEELPLDRVVLLNKPFTVGALRESLLLLFPARRALP